MPNEEISLLKIKKPKYFSDDVIKQVENDIHAYYLDVLGIARSIAADEQKGNEELVITEGIWNNAKWKTQFSWGNKKKPIIWVLEIFILFCPLLTGYGISNPSANWGFIVGGIVLTSLSYIIKISKENR